jgi:hypothetical protein
MTFDIAMITFTVFTIHTALKRDNTFGAVMNAVMLLIWVIFLRNDYLKGDIWI